MRNAWYACARMITSPNLKTAKPLRGFAAGSAILERDSLRESLRLTPRTVRVHAWDRAADDVHILRLEMIHITSRLALGGGRCAHSPSHVPSRVSGLVASVEAWSGACGERRR